MTPSQSTNHSPSRYAASKGIGFNSMRPTKHSHSWGNSQHWTDPKSNYYLEQTKALIKSTFPALFNPQRGKLRSQLEAAADLMDLIDYCDAIKLIGLQVNKLTATFVYANDVDARQQLWQSCYQQGSTIVFTATPYTQNYAYLKQKFHPRSHANYDRFLRKGFEIEATRRKLTKFTKAVEQELEGSLDLLILLTTG